MINQKEKLGTLVRLNPAYAPILLKQNIDFCCGGNRSLEDAANEASADLNHLIALLESTDKETATNSNDNYDDYTFEELINHILKAHHEFIYNESETTLILLNKVVKVHGENHPELYRIKSIVEGIIEELYLHQRKEENILFPYIVAMDYAIRNNESVPQSCFGDIRNPIRAMESDHITTGNVLMELKTLTDNFTAPENACNSYIALYQRLNELFNNIIQHIHLENNILHPKAIERFNQQ
ncbi:MAG: iron-sulfur cluster repair di-iron protein [Bacteroidales bacterium]